MKKRNKYFVIIIILMQLLLVSCREEKIFGPGTEEGLGFSSLEEFKENFAEFMAYPLYIPFEFDNEEGVMLSAIAGYNEKGFEEIISFINNPEKKYKRMDIFNNAGVGYIKYFNEDDLITDPIYKLRYVGYSICPSIKSKEDLYYSWRDFSEHGYKGYTIYCNEYINYDSNIIALTYYMKFDNKFYAFSIDYIVNKDTEKEKILEIRDKVKVEALDEAVKSYESLKYENKD